MQRALLILPCLKFLQLGTYTFYTAQCYWHNDTKVDIKYLLMIFVSTSTLFKTLSISIILLACKGWSIAKSSLSQGDMSTITVLMGATYLIYSSYYISLNIPNMQSSLTFSIYFLHFATFVVVVFNINKVLNFLQHQRRLIYENFQDGFKQAVDLKLSIIRKLMYFVIVYFTFELAVNVLMPLDLPFSNHTKEVIQ